MTSKKMFAVNNNVIYYCNVHLVARLIFFIFFLFIFFLAEGENNIQVGYEII